MEQLSEKEGNTNKNLLNYLLKCLPAYFISCISLYQCLPQSPSVIVPPTASHEQGPEHTTRPLRDDRQHFFIFFNVKTALIRLFITWNKLWTKGHQNQWLRKIENGIYSICTLIQAWKGVKMTDRPDLAATREGRKWHVQYITTSNCQYETLKI